MTEVSNKGDLNASLERAASSYNGYLMLLLMLLSMGWFGWALTQAIASDGESASAFVGLALSTTAFLFVSIGFFMIQPNQGVALTLFGAYRGTDRNEGLRCEFTVDLPKTGCFNAQLFKAVHVPICIVPDGCHGHRVTAQHFQAVGDVTGATAPVFAQSGHQKGHVQDMNLVGQDLVFEAAFKHHDGVKGDGSAN